MDLANSFELFEFFVHLVTALAIMVPAFFLYKMKKKDKDGDFEQAFMVVLFGTTFMALKHVFELLSYFNINVMPYGSLANFAYDHASTIITFLVLGWFFYWFDKKFVRPIHG